MNTQPFVRDLSLVGAGYWGKNLARNFNALGVLHTLCDNSQATLGSYGEDYGTVRKTVNFNQVLECQDIRKVAIAAPAALHYELAKSALHAGKDVFVEKPLCLDIQQGLELVELAKSKRCVMMVGHLLQYHPCVQKLQSLLAEGALGKLYYITSNRLNLGKIRREENSLWSFAPHDISVILSLAGGQLPDLIGCSGGAYLTTGVADTTLTTMRFANGLRAHVFVNWLNPFKEQKLTVVGSNGMAVFDDTRTWAEKLVLHRHYLTWADGQIPTPSKSRGESVAVAESEPLRNECVHFLECCQERNEPRTNGIEGLRVLQVLQTAQASLDLGGKLLSAQGITAAPPAIYVHPTAVVDEGAQIGKGTKIWHFSHIMQGAKIGQRCVLGQNVNVDGGTQIGSNVKVQNNVSIYSGTVIEDDVFLGPSCVLTNVTNPRSQVNRHNLYEQTVIKRGATIGANATIVCGVTIGNYAFIAAGSVVTKDVPDYGLMMGNPARQHGWMSRHGHRLGAAGSDGIRICPEHGLRYRETAPGVLRCQDLDEGAPLPEDMALGKKKYDDLKVVIGQEGHK